MLSEEGANNPEVETGNPEVDENFDNQLPAQNEVSEPEATESAPSISPVVEIKPIIPENTTSKTLREIQERIKKDREERAVNAAAVKSTATSSKDPAVEFRAQPPIESPPKKTETAPPAITIEPSENLDSDFDNSPIDTGFLNVETLGLEQSVEETINIPNSEEVFVVDTESVSEKTPVEKWNELNAKKEELVKELLGDLPPESRKILENKGKEISLEMIKQGCKISGRNFEDEKKKMEKEKETQWEISILASSGAKNIEAYKEQQRNLFKNNKQVMSDWCLDVIKNGANNLSFKQKENLLEKGELNIGGRIILEKEDVAILLKSGLDITKTGRTWGSWYKLGYPWGLGTDFTIGGKYFGDINQLNKFISEEKEKHLTDEFEKKYADRKKADVEQFAGQYVLDKKIKELHNSFISKESKNVIGKYFKGELENEMQTKEALWKLQQEEDKYRVWKKALEEEKNKKRKEKIATELLGHREEHKELAKAMIELANIILKKDIKAEAEKKNPANIGSEIYKIIYGMTESFREADENFDKATEPKSKRKNKKK